MPIKNQVRYLIKRLMNIKFMLLSSVLEPGEKKFNEWVTGVYADKSGEARVMQLQKFSTSFSAQMKLAQEQDKYSDVAGELQSAILGNVTDLMFRYERKDTPRASSARAQKSAQQEGFVACQADSEWKRNGCVAGVRAKINDSAHLLTAFLKKYTVIRTFLMRELDQIEDIGVAYQKHIDREMEDGQKRAAAARIKIRRNSLIQRPPAEEDSGSDTEIEDDGRPSPAATGLLGGLGKAGSAAAQVRVTTGISQPSSLFYPPKPHLTSPAAASVADASCSRRPRVLPDFLLRHKGTRGGVAAAAAKRALAEQAGGRPKKSRSLPDCAQSTANAGGFDKTLQP